MSQRYSGYWHSAMSGRWRGSLEPGVYFLFHFLVAAAAWVALIGVIGSWEDATRRTTLELLAQKRRKASGDL
jgi:hypothetical protein